MLKHDAYVVVGAGRRRGFPVVLRPEGAGATGDIAWQGWGRFGKRIARRCREASAFVSISPAVTAELARAGYDPRRIVALPNGVPVPEPAWGPRADWRMAPRAVFVGRLRPRRGSTPWCKRGWRCGPFTPTLDWRWWRLARNARWRVGGRTGGGCGD